MESDGKGTPGLDLGRITGILYLLIIVLGIFSEVGVRGALVVPGEAATTAARIAESEFLFRVGVVSDVMVFLADVAVAALLYVLLRPVSRVASLTAAGFRLTGTAIYGVNLLNQLAAILLLGGSAYLAGMGREGTQALALFFMELHGHGYDLGLVFFGLHCMVLGYLLLRSRVFPGVLGLLMTLAGVGYLVGSFTLFLFPAHASSVEMVYVAPLVGEVAFTFWLLVKGGSPEAAGST